MSLAGLPLFACWFAVLKPEVSYDGLAMHLVVPTTVAWSKSWSFDPHRFSWGLMPLHCDWLYTMAFQGGGEQASRLMNYAFLLLLCALVYRITQSFLAVALLASTPVVLLVTGSLFVENFWTLCVFGSFVCCVYYSERGERRYLFTGAILLGSAMATKLLALAYLPAIAGMFLWRTRRSLRGLVAFSGLLIIFAAPPYLTAFLRTGNPVFPLFNTIFRSPAYDLSGTLQDGRFTGALSYSLPFDLTFHTSRYLESLDGALGIGWLLLLPAAFLQLRRDSPFELRLAAGVFLSAGLITVAQQVNARYLYGLLPFAAVMIAGAIQHSPRLFACVTTVAVAINMYLYPAAGGYHQNFILLTSQERDAYILHHAPGKTLVNHLNKTADGSPVAFISQAQIAGLHGQAYLNSWHTYPFLWQLSQTQSEEEVATLLRQNQINYVVANQPTDREDYQPLHLKGFLQHYIEIDKTEGNLFAGHLRVANSPILRKPLLPGSYDDTDPALQYSGNWTRSRTFTRTYGNSVAYDDRKGDTISFAMQGASLTYVYTKAPIEDGQKS